MVSKLQHMINHMDMYRTCILKETVLAWKGGGGFKKHLLY